MRRRPGHHARGDGRSRRRRDQDQPAGAGRAGDRPLGDRRRVRHRRRVQPQRRDRVRPQPRALPVPALGPDRVRRLQGGAARHRHRAPGQHRAPGPGDLPARGRRRDLRLPRHLRRHRLAHHDGQRPRRGRLGRRRHRGRGGHARPARVDADPAGRRLQAVRRAARGRDGDRPGADHHRDAAPAQGGRQVRRVLRAGRLPGAAGQPGHHRQHEPRVRLDHRRLPDRRQDHRLPQADRPQRGADRAGRDVRQGAGPLARRRPRGRVLRVPRARPRHRRAEHRRAEAAAGPGHPGPRQAGLPRGARATTSASDGASTATTRPWPRPSRPPTRRPTPAATAPAAPHEYGEDVPADIGRPRQEDRGHPGRRPSSRSTTARWPSPRSPPAPTPPTRA